LLAVVVAAPSDAVSDGSEDEAVVASVVDERSLREVDDGEGVAVELGRDDWPVVAVGSSELSEVLSSCRRARPGAAVGAAATVCRQKISASRRSRRR